MRLVPERSPFPRMLIFPLGTLALSLVLAAHLDAGRLRDVLSCPLRDVTGIPCPTCGGTHSLIAMVQGRWLNAWAANPGVTLGAVLFVLWAGYALAATVRPGLRRSLEVSPREARCARWSTLLAILAVWIHQVVVLRG